MGTKYLVSAMINGERRDFWGEVKDSMTAAIIYREHLESAFGGLWNEAGFEMSIRQVTEDEVFRNLVTKDEKEKVNGKH